MRYHPFFKRLLDLFLSAGGLLIFSPLFYVTAILIRLDSPGRVFFRQQRVGQNFKPFQLIKFRSMCTSPAEDQAQFEPGDTDRVTVVGSFLRKTKLDELPGLFNIINGDMSLVGPRPEVRSYVDPYHEIFEEILEIKPGLTDYASIKYRNEEALLCCQEDPERYYQQVILPHKLRLAKKYKDKISLSKDLHIIVHTLKAIFIARIPDNRSVTTN